MEENKRIAPRLLKGFRDILPADFAVRRNIINSATNTLHTYGFDQLETPALEYAEILTGKLGQEGEKLLYQFHDHGGRHVAMRYDFTVPLARLIAQNQNLPKPFKRFQVGPVWRADNTQRGRYREFYQFDFDIVGIDSPTADAEIIVAMASILENLGVKDFVIRVNDRKFLENIANKLALPDNLQLHFYTGLDKWDKVNGAEGVMAYWQDNGIDQNVAQQLLDAVNDPDSLNNHPSQKTIEIATSMGMNPSVVRIDPTIVRGLDYYTGIVFETTLVQAPEYGSVFSGGRYDGLVGRFSKQHIPAVGASVGVDRLIAALEHLNVIEKPELATEVLVTVFNEELSMASYQAANSLRQSGINTEIWLDQPGKLQKQLKYASSKGIPFIVLLGPEEHQMGNYKLRSMSDGKEWIEELSQIIDRINLHR